ncbi:MAG: hypothetical protein IB617_00865 [Candidatus Nealsonbacteria bacterium]|nr:MAG: hypothetical protein IB617_00865 [Candidatus Nealsonbacteria bacterium]
MTKRTFTIAVEETIEGKEVNVGDIIYHKECQGKIEVKEITEAEIKDYKGYYHYNSKFLPLFCERCNSHVWVDLKEGSAVLDTVMKTSFDGKRRKITKKALFVDTLKRYPTHLSLKQKSIKVTVVQRNIKDENEPEVKEKPKEMHEKKSKKKSEEKAERKTKKTIRELKKKLVKIEQAKREVEEKAKKTIEKLREKLAKVAQVKEKASEFYCPSCGVQLTSIVSFCPFCGIKVEERIEETKEVTAEK